MKDRVMGIIAQIRGERVVFEVGKTYIDPDTLERVVISSFDDEDVWACVHSADGASSSYNIHVLNLRQLSPLERLAEVAE